MKLVNILLIGLIISIGTTDIVEGQQSAAFHISGTVLEEDENSRDTIPLEGVNIQLFSMPDSVRAGGAASNREGTFRIQNLNSGTYKLISSYLGFQRVELEVEITDSSIEDLTVIMKPSLLELEEFQVQARRPRVEVRGDTTAFYADGYQTNRDANIQDLVTRMPGFIIVDGVIQAQGENIVSVLVDGEEFFGDDAALVLQNLPAEIVDQIEVFDRQSEQARFTGFRDGNTDRTLNIVTKEGMNRGQFGRLNSGYGSQERYMAGGNYNYFRGSERLSVIGMTNNVNQQNFSSEDLLGISEAGGGRRGRGGATRNFRVGSQSGISSVHSTGINYNNNWNDRTKLNASYFFNLTDNTQDLQRERLYLTGFSADQQYDEDVRSTSDDYNHRFDMRLEHEFDENRSFIFSPRFSFQKNSSERLSDAFTLGPNNQLINEINQINSNSQTGYDFFSFMLYRHRFTKERRTFSANVRTRFNDQSGERFQLDDSRFYDGDENRVINDQQTQISNGGYSLSGNFSYTEPVTENTQLMLSYRPGFDSNDSVQDVFQFDEATNSYSFIDPALTNRYDNRLLTNELRSSYRFGNDDINANVSASWEHTSLTGNQEFPVQTEINQTWQNFLPGAFFRYNFGRRSNLRLSYNANTRTPSVRQLQDVINNNNPLRLTTGNPDLEQQLDHRVTLRLRFTNPEEGKSSSVYLSMTLTDNYIGNRTFVAQEDTQLDDGVILRQGARLISPENIGSALSLSSRFSRSIPFDLISSNLNLNAGVSYNQRPSFIDESKNITDTYRLNSRALISSNISDRVDFRASYSATYNIVENSIRPELNNNYYTGQATGSFNVMPFGGLVLESDFNFRHNSGLGDDFNQTSAFWNGSIGYKFLSDESAQFRVTMFDILAQNNNINRNILEDYIEDYRSNVLSRYVIFSFSYRFRSFPNR